MSKFYVFRINDGSKYFALLRKEILCGRLRQGWGASGMSIQNNLDEFISAWNRNWGPESSIEKQRRKYKNLLSMLSIEKGDIIVIPKVSLKDGYDYPFRCFTVARCVETYKFEIPNFANDYGHTIGIEPIFSCSYDFNGQSLSISAKFRAYQSAINNVWNEKFQNNVVDLIKKNDEEKIDPEIAAQNIIFSVADCVNEGYENLVDSVIDTLADYPPDKFEGIIRELFEKNNYIFIDKHNYDRQGGDIDITLSFDDKALLGNIFRINETLENPYINIQAKKKPGKDTNDIQAVKQLIDRAKSKNREDTADINIVIDLADEFQKETVEYARENKVVLINGRQFASLLIQFGLNGEISN